RIEPDWIEPLAAHLIKKTCHDPEWDARRGYVVAREQVSLYGLILAANRKINYGRVDPAHARELFIRGALVQGETSSKLEFLSRNQSVKQEVLELEAKSRRQDILADEDTLYEFFAQRVPADIHDIRHFERWYRQAPAEIRQSFCIN